jgi:SAM-dependent methyltransferase
MDDMGLQVKEFWDERYQNFNIAKRVIGELELPVNVDLTGKRVLIVSCGTGEHVVRACRQGANVVALDLSGQAVKNAQAMVSFNKLTAEYVVADAANTGLPAESFDLIWGSAVLHHLHHSEAAAETYRLLSPGGIACFVSEPTFFNPLLRWSYRVMFGLERRTRRDKFLFFKRIGDKSEMPIWVDDLAEWERLFAVSIYERNLMFLQKFGQATGIAPSLCKLADRKLDESFPRMRRYGYEFDFVFRRKSDQTCVDSSRCVSRRFLPVRGTPEPGR